MHIGAHIYTHTQTCVQGPGLVTWHTCKARHTRSTYVRVRAQTRGHVAYPPCTQTHAHTHAHTHTQRERERETYARRRNGCHQTRMVFGLHTVAARHISAGLCALAFSCILPLLLCTLILAACTHTRTHTHTHKTCWTHSCLSDPAAWLVL